MNNCNKKNSTAIIKASAIGHQTKGLKRSKSTQHLMPKKPTKKALQRNGSEENFYTNPLIKSKSSKSLKVKQKRQTRSQHSTKKSRPKKLHDTKTIKKNNHCQSREGNSIITQTEDNEPKSIAKEYFIYCNNYIPIENSAQRRLVYKIQMIDLQNRTTQGNFNKPKFESKDIGTQKVEVKQIAIGQKLQCLHRQIQTEVERVQKQKFQQTIQKCFIDVLTDLQFLYLPNETNFEPFTKNQRTHYGEMLQTLAKKMLAGNKNVVLTNQLTDDQAMVLIYQREGIQVGALEFIPQEGFPTHLLSILAYLKNLFCYIDFVHKEQIITNLRMFYGLNYCERVSRLSKNQPHSKESRPVLSDQIFQAFQYQMFKNYDFASEVAKQAVHWHNKAIFDSVNDQLQTFRPFYNSEGEPFPWTNNLGMTHYDITEEALFIIFVQAKEKIQKQVVTLCGIHIDFDDENLPNPHLSKFYTKKMQEKQKKMVIEQVKQYDSRVELDYLTSGLKFKVANEIFHQLINQILLEFFQRTEEEIEENCDFQQFN